MERILITGGAGFVGSNLSLRCAERFPKARIVAFDNLKRRGSELNLERFKRGRVEFVHGDVRLASDLSQLGGFDVIIDCAAEPSVLAGSDGSPQYVIDTNLGGTINTLELARRSQANVLFLSTSRIYPIAPINALPFTESETRFELKASGIAEDFPLAGARSIYGASKLASELLFEEYRAAYGLKGVVNRCGVLTGPWQMGKTDQGVIVLWMAAHYFQRALQYIGYGGSGKQVRDILHVDDLFDLLMIQLDGLTRFDGEVYNVGGGRDISVSLRELTSVCCEISGREVPVRSVIEDRMNDIRVYLSDCRKVQEQCGWKPQRSVRQIMTEIFTWIDENHEALSKIL
jgi:CDP-paratose 2-epimerase